MRAVERRAAIIKYLYSAKRRSAITTTLTLAQEFNVSTRTIKRDIDALTVEEHYQIDVILGNGGGLKLTDYSPPCRKLFSDEETSVLLRVLSKADSHEAAVIRGMLAAYGNVKVCEAQAV